MKQKYHLICINCKGLFWSKEEFLELQLCNKCKQELKKSEYSFNELSRTNPKLAKEIEERINKLRNGNKKVYS